MTTNMEYRQFLTNNADKIIEKTQVVSTDSCRTQFNTYYNIIKSPPILFNSINDDPPEFDNSDLKQKFLKWYRSFANKFTPGIIYN